MQIASLLVVRSSPESALWLWQEVFDVDRIYASSDYEVVFCQPTCNASFRDLHTRGACEATKKALSLQGLEAVKPRLMSLRLAFGV